VPQALPGVSASTPPAYSRPGGNALIRVVSPAELDEQDRARLAAASEANRPKPPMADLGAFVRQRWMAFRNHRNQGSNSLNDRLLRAQRMFEGKYDPQKLFEIKKFGGSEVYSRLVAVKCRGANSLLRDVYLGADRPWDIEPQPDPAVPPEIQSSIAKLIAMEVMGLQQAGQPVIEDQIHRRFIGLMHAAQQAARRTASTQATSAANKMDDILQAGGFYNALAEFLVDLPLFPFACIKGPVVRMVPKLTWVGGQPSIQNKPQMFWERIDPFNLYWSPGVAKIEDAEMIERKRLTRADLNDLLGLPGYDEQAVRAALQDYDYGLRDWLDATDTEEALTQGRENPTMNQSRMIDAIEYHGNVQGRMLLDQGVDHRLIPDLDRDYAVQTWIVGRHTLKTQFNPSPRQRHPYYVTSFEKVPGTVAGHGLPDILEDLQEMANATLRSLVNNMAIASGPQVVVNTDRLHPTENPDEMYPWKKWRIQDDPLGSQREPITFFQPQSNSQELLAVYSAVSGLADDISAIPRYATGESLKGGAGRTASGLSMLMGNSSKVLQTVAANVDIDVMRQALSGLYDMIMLTDQSGLLTGEEQIKVNGVQVTLQKETERQKLLQFLQITGNPIDMEVVGVEGRAKMLRAVWNTLDQPDDVVPDDDAIQQREKAKQQLAAASGNPGAELEKAKIENTRASALSSLAKAGLLTVKLPTGELISLDMLSGGAQGGQSDGSQGGQPAASTGQQAPTAKPTRLADHAPPFNAMQQIPQQRRGINV
jgi:hypothetical protein